MFERYTSKARRVIFFAKYEAGAAGSPFIETEHLLLGLLRESPAVGKRLGIDVEALRRAIEKERAGTAGLPTGASVDLPLSDECKRTLAYAAEDSQTMRHPHIGTEHLLLGLLRQESCRAARLLRDLGVDRERAWKEFTEGAPLPPEEDAPEFHKESLHALVDALPASITALLANLTHRPIHPGVTGSFGGMIHAGSAAPADYKTFTSSRVEEGTHVIASQRVLRGHEIHVIERMRFSDDGKTLTYIYEIKGPGKQERHEINFDLP
jgi:hypothetical protein